MPAFPIGRLVATQKALEALSSQEIWQAVYRHMRKDWGDLDEEDKTANDQALCHGARLLSAYYSDAGVKFWIITEADRSVTTVLLPQEY